MAVDLYLITCEALGITACGLLVIRQLGHWLC